MAENRTYKYPGCSTPARQVHTCNHTHSNCGCDSNHTHTVEVDEYTGRFPIPVVQSLKVGFSDPFLKNLTGSVRLDPFCGDDKILTINGNINAVSNLTAVTSTDSTTLNVDIVTTTVGDDIAFDIKGDVPLRVNGVEIDKPVLSNGYNLRGALSTEIPVDEQTIKIYAGSGVTAGDIYFTIPKQAVSTGINKFKTIDYDNSEDDVEVTQTDYLTVNSSSNAISITGDNGDDRINIGLRIDTSKSYNGLSLSTGGLVSHFIPRYIDTTNNLTIDALDTLPVAQELPVGSIAIWKTDAIPDTGDGVVIRKLSNSGSGQWIVLKQGGSLSTSVDITEQFTNGSGFVTGGSAVTLLNAPIINSEKVFYNGTRLAKTIDYTISGNVLTFVGRSFDGSEVIVIDYKY